VGSGETGHTFLDSILAGEVRRRGGEERGGGYFHVKIGTEGQTPQCILHLVKMSI
jgi:hypothetical protein